MRLKYATDKLIVVYCMFLLHLSRSIREVKKQNKTEFSMPILTEDIRFCNSVCEYKTKTAIPSS